MNFSSLKQHYTDWSIGNLDRIENKQRVSLSTHAYAVLLNDFHIFEPQETEVLNVKDLPSSFVNEVFRCFKSTARSSIAQAVQNQKILLGHMLQKMEDAQARQTATELMLLAFEQQLKEEQSRRCKQKDHTIVIRINIENQRYLLSDEGQAEGAVYHDKVGAYIKAVLEEYCEHPYVEREQIYYKEKLDEIQLAIDQKKLLKVTLRSKGRRDNAEVNNIMYVRPFAVRQDTERLYNYLVGITSYNREGPWQIRSLRLSSILRCTKQEHPISISGDTRKEIEIAIREKGVQFLSDEQDVQRIVVGLTKSGQRMYRSMLHLRPQLVEIIGDCTYVFACSQTQANNYFFKFGHHAKIIEPLELADMFRRRYASAEAQYTDPSLSK